MRERRDEREKPLWCGERAVRERGMKRETKGERESENREIEK